jgi:hypothetical protein
MRDSASVNTNIRKNKEKYHGKSSQKKTVKQSASYGACFVRYRHGSVRRNSKKPVDYVNPWIGSVESRYFYFKSACRPFGMVDGIIEKYVNQ